MEHFLIIRFLVLPFLLMITTSIASTSDNNRYDRKQCEEFEILLSDAKGQVLKILRRRDGIRNMHFCQEEILFSEFTFANWLKYIIRVKF